MKATFRIIKVCTRRVSPSTSLPSADDPDDEGLGALAAEPLPKGPTCIAGNGQTLCHSIFFKAPLPP